MNFADRICQGYGKTYTPTNTKQRYCNAECRDSKTPVRSRFKIFERDEFRCIYCGMSSIEDAAQLHIEHIVPQCKQGTDTVSNVVTACRQCNAEKQGNTLEESVLVRVLSIVAERNFKAGYPPSKPVNYFWQD